MKLKDYSIAQRFIKMNKQSEFVISMLNTNLHLTNAKLLSNHQYETLRNLADGDIYILYSNHYQLNGVMRHFYGVWVNLPEELFDLAISQNGVLDNQHLIKLVNNHDPFFESEYSVYLNDLLAQKRENEAYLKRKKENSIQLPPKLELFANSIIDKLDAFPELQLRCREYNEAVTNKSEAYEILANEYESLKVYVHAATI